MEGDGIGVDVILTSLSQLRDEYFSSGDPTLQDASRIPDEFDDPMDHYALAFQYYGHAYEMWLDQFDEFIEANEELESRYGGCVLFGQMRAF